MTAKDSCQISVIIPVYNDPLGLNCTVNTLLNQNFPKNNYEIIIVDNGSTDGTKKTAWEFQSSFADLVRFESEDNIQSSYAARNKGIKIARGKIICFIDSDMTVSSDYLMKIAQKFKNNKIDYLGCRVAVTGEKNTLTEKYNKFSGFQIRIYLERDHFVCTCCLSVKKTVFDVIGFFDDRLESGGDNEFGQRVYRAGLNQAYCDDIVINHPARWKYSQMIQKNKRTSRGLAQLSYYYPDRYRSLVKRYFTFKFYCPLNPVKTFMRCREKGITVSWLEAIVISFIPIPLQIAGLRSFFKMRRSLVKTITEKV